MQLKKMTTAVTSKVGRQVLLTKKHSPTLLFAVGVAGVVTTVVLASKATLKMDQILEEAEKNKSQIDDAEAMEVSEYDQNDANKDRVTNRVQTIYKICKLYAPAFAVGVISIGCLTGSHVILSRRNVALTAAYAALDKGFREYRERVVDDLGREKDEEFRYGVIEKEIAVDTDHGVDVKTVKVLDKNGKGSIYARLFAQETSRNWQPQQNYNSIFLQSQQNYANDRLRRDGFLLLNDVYESLGLERSKEGCVVGWVRNNPRGGDSFIDFGVFSGDAYMGKQFVNGNEPNVWLDFNVDGVVYDLI
jgi:hypothetical protein